MGDREANWDLYRSFLAVLQEGSLSAAARALGLTQPTLGRHIEALEQSLGFELFTRSRHGLAPTEAAEELRPYAESLAAGAAALRRIASGRAGELRGSVRVTASEVVGVEVLPPILAALRREHPQLVIELVLSNSLQDLLRRDADIAVRMVAPSQEALLARRIGTIELGLHARRDYLERCGAPASLAELEQHALIGYDRETVAIRRLARGVEGFRRAHFAFRADSDLAQLAAIRAGYGIGICQVPLAARDPTLVRLLPEALSLQLDTWVAMHENLKSNRRCRLVFDRLAAGLKDYLAGVRR